MRTTGSPAASKAARRSPRSNWFTCGIKSGSEVTPQQLEELLAESARRKMMNKALDLLSMRDYSRRELSDKLVTKAWEKKEQKDMDLGSLKQQASRNWAS